MNALAKIKAAGFVVELEEGGLVIEPFSKLTTSQIGFLKSHKAEIMAELEEQAANDKYACDPLDHRHHCHECRNLAGKLCTIQRFMPVDDLPRRCPDYTAGQRAIIVTCYSPSGLAYDVEASNPEHADFLKRMNPKPTNVRNIKS